MEIKTLEIAGMASVLNALRLPFGRVCRSDCEVYMTNNTDYENPMLSTESRCVINNKDMSLLSTLVKRGDEHSKALRGLVVYAEINAPLYWWSEMDTYRIGTDRLSSESTMHMIGGMGFTPDKFDSDDDTILNAIDKLETLSKEYRETRSTDILIAIKGIIPSSFKQRRIQMFSYPTLRRIWIQRHNHRLPHWHKFCEWIETLPFFDMLIMPDKDKYIDNDKTNRNG